MAEQLAFKGLEQKDEVFYARCRPKIKQALYMQMERDGFKSMTDWFEQFVMKTLGGKACKPTKKKTKKKISRKQ